MIAALNMLARLVKREVTIVRLDATHDGIFGKMLIDNKPFVYTLEHSALKIPPGHYLCTFVNSNKNGDGDPETEDVYEITEVDGRTNIQIHVGNTIKDTTGCICLGMKRGDLGGKAAVLNSRDAVNEFHKAMDKKDFLLSIYDVTGGIDGY